MLGFVQTHITCYVGNQNTIGFLTERLYYESEGLFATRAAWPVIFFYFCENNFFFTKKKMLFTKLATPEPGALGWCFLASFVRG